MDLQSYRTTQPDAPAKFLIVEFWRAISRATVMAVSNKDPNSYENVWALVFTFWATIRNNKEAKPFRIRVFKHKHIDGSEREYPGLDERLLIPPKNVLEMQWLLYDVLEAAAECGIFIDYDMNISDYDPELRKDIGDYGHGAI